MSTQWITDRLPTRDDVKSTYNFVWVTWEDGKIGTRHWSHVAKNQPWQPFQVPAPYVKPKRWTVEWNSIGAYWVVVNDDYRVPQYYLNYKDQDAAQRIAEIYNEVMP
jgi:hypothetical protein